MRAWAVWVWFAASIALTSLSIAAIEQGDNLAAAAWAFCASIAWAESLGTWGSRR